MTTDLATTATTLPTPRAPWPRRAWSGLLAAAISSGLVATTGRVPLFDGDAPMHVVVGRQILTDHRLTHLPVPWLADPAPAWTPLQWLSEVSMAGAVDAGGWRWLVVARVLLLTAAVATCWCATVLRAPSRLAPLPFLLCVTPLVFAVQDRPAAVSLVLLPLLAAAAVRLWSRGTRPPLVVVALTCLVWSQLHGAWVLAPVGFLLVAIGTGASAGAGAGARGRLRAARPALACGAASLAGLVNPLGWEAFTLPSRLSGFRYLIVEWHASTTQTFDAKFLALTAALIVVAWTRGRRRPPAAEVVWVLAWLWFATTAQRNITPVVLLLAPVAVAALHRAWPRRDPEHDPLPRATHAVALGILLVGTAIALADVAGTPALERVRGVAIAQHLAQGPPVRVFNTYNSSGALIGFSAGKARLVVDDRASEWPVAYVRRLYDAEHLETGWQATLAAARPDVLVLYTKSPLAEHLVDAGSWRVAMTDRDLALLVPAGP